MFEPLVWLRRLQLNVAIAAIVFGLVAGAAVLGTAVGDDSAQAAASSTGISTIGR